MVGWKMQMQILHLKYTEKYTTLLRFLQYFFAYFSYLLFFQKYINCAFKGMIYSILYL